MKPTKRQHLISQYAVMRRLVSEEKNPDYRNTLHARARQVAQALADHLADAYDRKIAAINKSQATRPSVPSVP